MDVHPTKNVSIGIDPYPNTQMASPNWVPQTFRKSLVPLTLEAAFALPLAFAWQVHAAVPVPETTA